MHGESSEAKDAGIIRRIGASFSAKAVGSAQPLRGKSPAGKIEEFVSL